MHFPFNTLFSLSLNSMQNTQITNKNLIRHTYPTNLALLSRSNFANTLFGAQPPHQTNLKIIFHLKLSFFLFLWEEKPAGKSFFCLFCCIYMQQKLFQPVVDPQKFFSFIFIIYIHLLYLLNFFHVCAAVSRQYHTHQTKKKLI